MKIDQSICNDWTLSSLKNCLKACGLKIKIASEQSVSLALCAGVSCMYLHLFVCVCVYVCVFCVCEHRCVLFVLRAHACFVVHGQRLYPRAVLPVRSQVFISLDSGRQITRPQAATHPSFQGLPKTAFNMHYSLPCCYKPNFQLLSIGLSSRAVGVRQRDALARRCCVYPEVQLCSFWIHAFPHATLNDTVPCVQRLHFLWCAVCHLELVSPVSVCIFVYTSLCVVVSESAWCRVLGKKWSLRDLCPWLDRMYSKETNILNIKKKCFDLFVKNWIFEIRNWIISRPLCGLKLLY